MTPGTCIFCGQQPAPLLCDYMLGRDIEQARVLRTVDDPFLTCDAPLCCECATLVGNFCGQGSHDTLDLCPLHRDMGIGDQRRLLYPRTVEIWRRRLAIELCNGLPGTPFPETFVLIEERKGESRR